MHCCSSFVAQLGETAGQLPNEFGLELSYTEAADATRLIDVGGDSEKRSLTLGSGHNGSEVPILERHMARLKSGWLHDEVINAFHFLLQEREMRLREQNLSRHHSK